MTIAYVYKWTHLPTLKWYVGSRSRKNCHPNDGYICTQEYVYNAVKWYPSEWKENISNALKGFKRGPMSEEHKKLRSEANKLAWAKKKSQVQN